MPRLSDKEFARRELWASFARSGVFKGWCHPDTRRLLLIHEGFIEQWYTNPRDNELKSNWAVQIFPQYDDNRWRVSRRMDPESFKFILSLIEDHLIFYNRSTCPQTSVKSQQDIATFTTLAYLADFGYTEQTTSGLKLPNIGPPGSGRHCRGDGLAEQL